MSECCETNKGYFVVDILLSNVGIKAFLFPKKISTVHSMRIWVIA